MYVHPDFPTKKALKEALASGRPVSVFAPSGLGDPSTSSGKVYLEGPNFRPHSWYAVGEMKNGVLVSVK